MNSNENIRNAFKVVYKTYENIDKLIKYCKTICEDNGYVVCSNKFLRWKSDNNFYGWAINNFILLFQDKEDIEIENGFRKGPIYSLEIDFNQESLPTVYLSKYEYIRIEEWSSQPISPSDNWRFYWPTRKREYFKMHKMDDYEVYTPEINSEVVRNKSYWGLDRIVRYSEDLTEINANNVDEKIFKRFDLIKNI